MKKLLISLLIGLSCRVAWADTKISAMSSTNTLNAGDIIPVVTNPGGTPANMSITKTNLSTTLDILTQSSATVTYLQKSSAAVTYCYANGTNCTTSGVVLIDSPTWTGVHNWINVQSSTFTRLNVTYNLNTGSTTGSGLSTCGDGTHAVNYNATTGLFGCQLMTGGGGGASSLEVLAGVQRTSPTVTVGFPSTQFEGTVTGASMTVTLLGSSVTLQGNSISLSALSSSMTATWTSTGTLATSIYNLQVSTGNLKTQDFNLGTSTQALAVSTGTLYALSSGKVNYASFTVTNPLTYNNTTGAIGILQVSLSTGVIGTLPSANLVSTVAYTSSTNTWSAVQNFNNAMASTFTALTVGTVNVGTALTNIGTSTGTLYTLASGKVNYASFTVTNPLTYNNTTGAIGILQVSLSSGVTGVLPAANMNQVSLSSSVTGTLPSGNMVSTVAFTNSTQTFTAAQTFTSSATHTGALVVSTSIILSGNPGTSGQVIQSGGPNALASWATLTGATLASTQTWTGGNTLTSSTTFSGAVVVSSTILLSNSPGTNGQALTTGGPNATPTWTSMLTASSATATYVQKSSASVTVSISSGTGYNSLTIPVWRAPNDTSVTIFKILAESLPASTTVLYQLDERAFGSINSAGSSIFSVQYSTANNTGVTTTAFADASIAINASLVLTTPAVATGGTPTSMSFTIYYKRDN
jgi:hypothetical protein